MTHIYYRASFIATPNHNTYYARSASINKIAEQPAYNALQLPPRIYF